MTTASTVKTIIDLVDNYNYRVDSEREHLLKFLLPAPSGETEVTIGWIREPVLPYIRNASDVFTISSEGVRFQGSLNTFKKRSAAIAAICAKWRDDGLFSDTIGPKKWRDELYPVYFDPFQRTALGGKDVAFAMERTCCALFGLVTYVRDNTLYLSTSLQALLI